MIPKKEVPKVVPMPPVAMQPCPVLLLQNALLVGRRKRGKSVAIETLRKDGECIVIDGELQRLPGPDIMHVQGFYTQELPELFPLLQSFPAKLGGREARVIVDGTSSVFKEGKEMRELVSILGTARHVKLGYVLTSWRLVGFMGPSLRAQFDHVLIWEMDEETDWQYLRKKWGEQAEQALKTAPRCTSSKCLQEDKLGDHTHYYLHAGPGQAPHLHAPYPLIEPK